MQWSSSKKEWCMCHLTVWGVIFNKDFFSSDFSWAPFAYKNILILYQFHFPNEEQIPLTTQLESIFYFCREYLKNKMAFSLTFPIEWHPEYSREKCWLFKQSCHIWKMSFRLSYSKKRRGLSPTSAPLSWWFWIIYLVACQLIFFLNRVLEITKWQLWF